MNKNNSKLNPVFTRVLTSVRNSFSKLAVRTNSVRQSLNQRAKTTNKKTGGFRTKTGALLGPVGKTVVSIFDRIIGSRFSVKEQSLFMKRFAFLINAGVPVVEGLNVLRDQSKFKRHARIFDTIINDASNGQALSKSFAKFPKLFSQFSIHIIKIGESSGTLSQNLDYLADELKKKHALKRKIISAFIYPAIVTTATLAITAFLMVYLFPKIIPIFSSLHMKLPLTTRIVIATSNFLQHWGLTLLSCLVVAVIFYLISLRRSMWLRTASARLSLRIPTVGVILQYFNVSNGSRTLGLLLKSGIRLSDALPIAADTTNNLVYKKAFNDLASAVDRGEGIAIRLRRQSYLFPDIFAHMIAVGEKSGTLPDTLVYLSEMYENEVDEFTKNLSTLLEPALMIFMGIVIGFIAISIITPIYGITQNLHG